jgi:hypothetical protein
MTRGAIITGSRTSVTWSCEARCRRAAQELLTKFPPVLLVQLYFVFLRSGLDAFPGVVAFRISYPVHLLEAGDCVADVSSVMNGFFTFLGESEVFIGDAVATSFSDLGHAC